MSVTVLLADQLDVGRGDMICAPGDAAGRRARELDATVCWMAEAPLRPGGRYPLKHTTRTVRATIESLDDRVDMETLERQPRPAELALNDIGRVRLRTSAAGARRPVRAQPRHRRLHPHRRGTRTTPSARG